jgi:hypothetical protein
MKEERLRHLLEKYYDGNTSAEEEKELKEFFYSDGIIPGYEAEKDIFSHYARPEKIPVPSADFESRIIKAVNDLEIKKRQIIIRKRLIVVLSTAAAILILIGSYFVLFKKSEPADSYSDPRIAYIETMKILNEVSVKLNRGTMALHPISKITTAARMSIKSVDRSVNVMSAGLERIGLSGQFSETISK